MPSILHRYRTTCLLALEEPSGACMEVAFRDMIPVLVSPSLSTLRLSACLPCRRSREVHLKREWTNNRSPS